LPRPTQPFPLKVRRRVSAVWLLLALPLLVAACGGTTGTAEPIRLVVTPVASPTPTPLAAPTVPPVTYRVKAGDTLSGIADIFGVSVDDIVRANNIADPNSLAEGQTLTIPGRSLSPTPKIETTTTPVSSTMTPATATPTPASFATPVLPPPDVTPPLGPTTPPSSPQ
jgi:LysM repeat protein